MKLLSKTTPACFVAFDLLALDETDLTDEPMARRRALLEEILADAPPGLHHPRHR